MVLAKVLAAVVAAVLAVALLAGCSGAGTAGAGLAARTADPALISAAALVPCPASGASTGAADAARTAAATAGGSAAPAGQPLPELTLPCLGGGPGVDLAGLRGPLLINVWASDCAPCRQEVPLLQRLAGAAGGRVRVLGIDLDAYPDDGLHAADAFGMHYPSLSDQHSRILGTLPVIGTPTTFFVDASGRLAGPPQLTFTSWQQLAGEVQARFGIVP